MTVSRRKYQARAAVYRLHAAKLRSGKGSAITEMGPALFILLIFAIFPVVNLIFMGMSYMSCVTLNDLQLREAAKTPKSQAELPTGPVQKGIFDQWRQTAIGGISGVTDQPQTDISYSTGAGTIYVTVSTTVNIKPLLTIPFFPAVPGMGAPFTCNITHSRLLENPKFVFY